MPTSREMAQRYAAASKRKKRRDGGPRVIIRSDAGVEEMLADPAELVEAERPAESQPREVAAGPRVVRARTAVRRVAPEYVQDYSYVRGDLRRVVMVSGGLLIFLIVLALLVLH